MGLTSIIKPYSSMTTTREEFLRRALDRAAEITGKEDAADELQMTVGGMYSYISVRGQLVAAIKDEGESERIYEPAIGMVCIN